MPRVNQLLVPLFVGLVSLSASAAPVPVQYLIELREFRSEAAAGVALAFDVYGSESCTGSIAYSELKFVGSTDVRAERVISQRAKGQAPAPPRAIRLRSTLEVPTVEGQLFLKVSGPGIAAIDTDCQPQTAGVSSSAGEDSGVPTVSDGNGVVLGTLVSGDPGEGEIVVFHSETGSTVRIFKNGTTAGPVFRTTTLFFENSGCSGLIYILSDGRELVGGSLFVGAGDGLLYVTSREEVVNDASVASELRANGTCFDEQRLLEQGIQVSELVGGLGWPEPLALPLTLGLN